MSRNHRVISGILAALVMVIPFGPGVEAGAGSETLTFQELMKFKKIVDPMISEDGAWIAYTLKPDRGENEVVARSVDDDEEFRIERGGKPLLSSDSRWLVCALTLTQEQRDETAQKSGAGNGEKAKDDGPYQGMALLSLFDGIQTRFDDVESFAFSDDSHWMAWKRYKPKDDEEEEKSGPEEAPESEQSPADDEKERSEDEDRPLGTTLVLRNLVNGQDDEIPHVMSYVFDEPSRHLAYTVAGPGGEPNGAYIRTLESGELSEIKLHGVNRGRYTHLNWAEDSSRLAFIAAIDDEDFEPGPASLWFWDPELGPKPICLASSLNAPEGWRIPSENNLTWSRDGQRVFFGYSLIDPEREKRRLEKKQAKKEEREHEKLIDAGEMSDEDTGYDPYDVEALLKKRRVDIWHGEDPLIIPHQKERWKEEKKRTYLAVAHIDREKTVRLAGLDVPDAEPSDNSRAVLAYNNLAYRRLQTWDAEYADLYHVDLKSGRRLLVAKRLREPSARISPEGRYVVFYNDQHWFLFDADSSKTRNLTESLPVSFSNEDDDYPAPDPGYGIADWLEKDLGVLIYDKFDLWRFPAGTGQPVNLTEGKGRKEKRQYRLLDLDIERDFVIEHERLLLSSYHDVKKNHGFWQIRADRGELKPLLEADFRYHFLHKAKNADRLLFTRESYTEFPDLWVSGLGLKSPQKLSDANPQIDRFARGTAELVEWSSADGIPLQGVLIKPGNFQPGQGYPVIVYFYRFFSERLYHFNEPVINHRPNFAVYASDDYIVFLPDIRFEIGRPGMSAVKALVPGVQKLIDLGIADPKAIGLHGHSWSGYQAAYVVTQTNFFTAAVAGAPVSNMTSAYSGIRLGSGMARQFQYEKSQSRIGGSLDAELFKYIENSPVFYVGNIETPLLIQFGDRDEAVPWQQGIELYLAMRRLNKDVIFLQYRNEPHHLKNYSNKLDYSIKMKQYFDHHLKGDPAPEWMTDGVPYIGE